MFLKHTLFSLLLMVANGLGVELRAQAPETRPGFEVHEWGTFTSMQGSDGLALEGLQHEEERLPGFVYSRTEVRDCPLREFGYKGLEVPVERVTQKMETPVIYFYANEPLDVRVRVDFVGGLISQWYPVVDRLGPPELVADQGPLDLRTIERSFLEWDLGILPFDAETGRAPVMPPGVNHDDPWRFARETKAAGVRTKPRTEPRMGPNGEEENFLFYRGLGTFELPLHAATTDDRLMLRNTGDLDLPVAFALEMDKKRARFRPLGRVAGHSESSLGLEDQPWQFDEVVVEELSKALLARLVDQGLFLDEAQAMLKTWSRSWLRSLGTRVIYILPRPTVDALLPLQIEPRPETLVRVLVGRLEIVTRAMERRLEADLRAADYLVRTAVRGRF
ncbi:MAG: hypothetical protein KDB53_17510, partial [Planctomycetes bacterium]|nr:hypothetical protein [Planctomycetota bacterium]